MRKLIYGVKNLIRWFPTIWKDRDYDHYYIMEILKKKLLFQAKSTRERSNLQSSEKYAEQMETCAVLLHIVQNETHIEELIRKTDSTDQDLHKAITAHEKARIRLFKIMEENIEHWWS